MLKKIIIGLLLLVIVVVAGAFIFIQVSWNKTYDIAYPTHLKTSTDSAVVARGEYIVRGPAHCSTCHISSFDEILEGKETVLKGGVTFPVGPLGTLYPPNLTPDAETGIGRYRDEEIFRMMRHAVKPDGTASISLLMPFYNMADEDLEAVVSYLRSMEPVRNEVPPAEFTFLGKFVKTVSPAMRPVTDADPPAKAPAMEATIERGEYMSKYVANCAGCHTAFDMETLEQIGPDFAGGAEFEPLVELNEKLGVPANVWTRSPNITPHADGALAKFPTVEDWIARFRQGRVIPNSPMHWGPFSKMTDDDLAAIYLYLNSLEPVEWEVGPAVFTRGE